MQSMIDPSGGLRCLYDEAIPLQPWATLRLRGPVTLSPISVAVGLPIWPLAGRPTARTVCRAQQRLGRRTSLAGGALAPTAHC